MWSCGDDGGAGNDANGSIDASGAIDGAAGPDAGPVTYGDMAVAMVEMGAHTNQLMEFRVVSAGDVLAARGVLDTLLPEDNDNHFTFRMPASVPSDATYRLDFFADLDGDRVYTTTPDDHAWRVAIPSNGNVPFLHNTNFQDIDLPPITQGEDFQIDFFGMGAHDMQLIELRVINTDTGQAVGHYRLTAASAVDFSFVIEGIIENGANYDVDFYADFNANGMYDAPPVDHAWRETGVGTASGLTITFNHNTTFTDIGF